MPRTKKPKPSAESVPVTVVNDQQLMVTQILDLYKEEYQGEQLPQSVLTLLDRLHDISPYSEVQQLQGRCEHLEAELRAARSVITHLEDQLEDWCRDWNEIQHECMVTKRERIADKDEIAALHEEQQACLKALDEFEGYASTSIPASIRALIGRVRILSVDKRNADVASMRAQDNLANALAAFRNLSER